MKNILTNLSVLLIFLTLSIVSTEIVLFNFTDLRILGEKVLVRADRFEGFSNCYSSNNKDYFPISLNSISGRAIMRETFNFSEGYMDSIANKTPYCIYYNTSLRRQGYNPERSRKVAIVGDSFAFGEGVKDEDTLSYFLNAKFTAINFQNYGSPGYDVMMVNQTFFYLINENKSEAIIYFYNLNDILLSEELKKRLRYIMDFQNVRMSKPKFYSPESKFASAVTSRSTIYNLWQRSRVLKQESQSTVQNYLDMYFDPANAKQLQETLDIIKKMSAAAERKGIKFYVVIYPLLYKNSNGYPFMRIHSLITDFCEKNDIKCIDGYEPFSEYGSLKRFTVHDVDFHPNGKSNELMVDFLVEKNKLDLRK